MSAADPLRESCESAARAAAASRSALALLTGGERTALLHDIAASIRRDQPRILEANAVDLAAGAALSPPLSPALRDRLTLTAARVESMAAAVDSIARQGDPIGKVVDGRVLANGARLEKRRVPIGVILMIYESRPNVTSDAAALCLKSGNAVILRGGKEAAHTNRAVANAVRAPLVARGIPDAVSLIETADRRAIDILVTLRGLIDLVIPRGGPALIKAVSDSATIPVIKHDAGNCHIYIDEHLDALEDAAVRITVNAKAQRPGVCNAAETLLIHAAAADRMLPRLAEALIKAGVELRCCERSRAILRAFPAERVRAATEADWDTEYLDLILAVKVVDSLDAAAAHILRHGSKHTEAIVTSSIAASQRFIALIDSASVMVNCSTRFADGGEYGLGAEIGISTDKLHARGPMGAEDLTTFQWILTANGQVRA